MVAWTRLAVACLPRCAMVLLLGDSGAQGRSKMRGCYRKFCPVEQGVWVGDDMVWFAGED